MPPYFSITQILDIAGVMRPKTMTARSLLPVLLGELIYFYMI